MIITKDKVVSIEYTLKDAKGEILDSSESMGPLDYIHGHQNIIPGLEKALEGKKSGDTLSVEVEPAEAYGEYQQDLVLDVPRSQFQIEGEIEEGMQFEAGGSDGSRLVTVVEVATDTIKIDANHPLAGEKLFFDISIGEIRDATEDELKRGSLSSCGCGCGDDCDDGCDCGEDSDGSCGCGCCG